MRCRDAYGYELTCSSEAARAFDRGVQGLLRLRHGAERSIAEALAHDPTFALAHASLALLGHETTAAVDVEARLRDAVTLAPRATERERSSVHAIAAHVAGDSQALVRHLDSYPLAFVRQEQGRYDEAMDLSCRSLAEEPTAGHSAHARAHAHYETGDHRAGLAWMDAWVRGAGAGAESLSHFAWHAALHELSLGDLDAVRARYQTQLRPDGAHGCRALVDTGSLLFRWALTPDAQDVPDIRGVADATSATTLTRPATPFLALHAAVLLLALHDEVALGDLEAWAAHHDHPVQRQVVAPLAGALRSMATGGCSAAADQLAALSAQTWRLGGSDAQREIIEEARISALLRADRHDEARVLLDARLDRRESPRDRRWRESCRTVLTRG
jgi:hypothetical protein